MKTAHAFAFAICFLATVGSSAVPPRKPSAARITDRDFAYLLVQAEVVAESPSTDRLPPNHHWSYRILGFSQQGSCTSGCPPSTIYVAVWDYTDFEDGHIRALRIDGIRFYSFLGVKEYKPGVASGTFLVFRVLSRPDIDKPELFEVRVSQDACTITKVIAASGSGT